jgi:hypothetical protein
VSPCWKGITSNKEYQKYEAHGNHADKINFVEEDNPVGIYS